MFLFTLVLGLLLLPEADTLKCEYASNRNGYWSGVTTECSSQYDRCSAETEVRSLSGTKLSELNFKGCSMSSLCLNVSMNNGVFALQQKSSCCSGDFCNNQTDYPKPEYTPNGKKCFTCDGENCMKTLNCTGDENYCIKVTGKTVGVSLTTKGCGSETVCSDQVHSLVNQLITLVPRHVPVTKISCCQGDYCNSASSASPALLLLLVPLLFFNLFS